MALVSQQQQQQQQQVARRSGEGDARALMPPPARRPLPANLLLQPGIEGPPKQVGRKLCRRSLRVWACGLRSSQQWFSSRRPITWGHNPEASRGMLAVQDGGLAVVSPASLLCLFLLAKPGFFAKPGLFAAPGLCAQRLMQLHLCECGSEGGGREGSARHREARRRVAALRPHTVKTTHSAAAAHTSSAASIAAFVERPILRPPLPRSAPLTKPTHHNGRPHAQVLPEDEYLASIEAIVERDFFPDIQKMRSQQEWITAVNSGDPHLMRQAQVRLVQGRKGNGCGRAGQKGKWVRSQQE